MVDGESGRGEYAKFRVVAITNAESRRRVMMFFLQLFGEKVSGVGVEGSWAEMNSLAFPLRVFAAQVARPDKAHILRTTG
jgi:hypothetical protein